MCIYKCTHRFIHICVCMHVCVTDIVGVLHGQRPLVVSLFLLLECKCVRVVLNCQWNQIQFFQKKTVTLKIQPVN